MTTDEQVSQIIDQLRAAGSRITERRKAVITFIVDNPLPFSVPDIQSYLSEQELTAEPSTLYREIDTLVEQGIIVPVQIDSKKQYYELQQRHHHHIRCINCNDIQDIEIPGGLAAQINDIQEKTGYQVVDHLLEFTGLCSKCK